MYWLHLDFDLNAVGKTACKTQALLTDILQPHVKLREATVNPPTMSEGNVFQLFWTSLGARCMSSDETVLD